MRKSGHWMTIWDDRILEYTLENEHGSPTEIASSEHIHVTKQHISRRLRVLADHGLLTLLKNAVYKITTEGEQYLQANYDAEAEAYTNQQLANSKT